MATLRDAGHVAYFAGGCVRDALMGVEPNDFDVATDATPDQVSCLFRRTKKVGAKFGVVMVRMGEHELEVATFRSEGNYADHRHPAHVQFTNAEADANRRDFTINGMFFDPVENRVIDSVGGQADLRARIIRAIGNPRDRFEEDHLRMLRAVRFASRLAFTIEPATFEAIRRQAPGVRTISPERIRMELEQILEDTNRERGWRLLHAVGLSAFVVDGLTFSDADVEQAARRLAALPAKASFPLALAAVLHERTDPPTRAVCVNLRMSVAETDCVSWLLQKLPQTRAADQLELADVKLLRADPRFEDLVALLRAEARAAEQPPVAADTLARRADAIAPADVRPLPFVNGDDLLARGVPPGRRLGRILDSVFRAQLNEQIGNREEALTMAEGLIRDTSEPTEPQERG
ncbi:MAG: CCA tRNA nucleotidyltransferase [Phycisphaerae bacterium]|nr:CCA tRNA nucleotidyltransferase [Phycisphaerae bacterium]